MSQEYQNYKNDYFEQVRQKGEHITHVARFHPFIDKVFYGFLILAGILLFAYIIWGATWLMAFSILCLIIAVDNRITKFHTRIIVSNKRIICQGGYFVTDTEELSAKRISEVNITQLPQGRKQNFGQLTIYDVGGNKLILPDYIEKPFELKKAIDNAIFKKS